MIRFTVGHPTARVDASSPLWWYYSMQAYFKRCDHPELVEYVLVVHESNWETYQEFSSAPIPPWGSFMVVKNTGANTSNAQGNVAGQCATGKVIIGSMDDLFPPEHWDTLLWEAINSVPYIHPTPCFPNCVCGGNGGPVFAYPSYRENQPAVIHVSSGSPLDADIFIPWIQTKARYDEFGYGGHPAYESMYADNELTLLAKRDRVVIEAPHIVFEHRHPLLGKSETDEVYRQQNRSEAYVMGQMIFEARKAAGFPKDPNWRLPETTRKPRVICLCLPGEHFTDHYVCGLLNTYGYLLTQTPFSVQVAMAHTTNVYATRFLLTEMVLKQDPKPDLVLWVDDDNVLDRDQVSMLIADLDSRPDLAGVVGWCWCDRNDETDRGKLFVMSCGLQGGGPIGEGLPMLPLGAESLQRVASEPLVPIDWSGFPCGVFRREVFEAVGPGAFAPIVRPDVKFGFTSEDTAFFFRAKEAGFKFAVDLRCKLPHVKIRAIEPQYVARPELANVTP